MGSPVMAQEPVSIESLPDDTILILDLDAAEGQTAVYHYDKAGCLGIYHLDTYFQYFQYLCDDPDWPMPYRLLAHDFAFVTGVDTTAADLDGKLYVSAADRKQTFVFDLKVTIEGLSLALQDCYYPMRTPQGKALVAAAGKVFYDADNKWLPLIAQRSHYWKDGQVTTRTFDGKQHDCVWHRIFLDAVIPDGAGITIECRAANDKELIAGVAALESGAWKGQPQAYRRTMGSDIPYHEPYAGSIAMQKNAGTWETLLHSVSGRYLTIRLTLTGTGRNSPHIRSLRVYYPRFSYLNEYLPAVYRDDEISADFLERFLANFEGLLTTIEDRIAWAQVLLDVDSVPAEFLDWLAGWFEIIQQETWGEGRRRLWLTHAMELFSQRGTVPGIIRAVRLATDPCPDESIFTEDVTAYYHPDAALQDAAFSGFHVRIVEKFLLRQAPGVAFGDPTAPVAPGIYTQKDQWEPALGTERLNKDYQEYLGRKYNGSIEDLNKKWQAGYNDFLEIKLPPLRPEPDTMADDWIFFLQHELNFTYTPVACNKTDTIAFQNYLARRYRTVGQLNTAWSLSADDKYVSFDTIQLPRTMPTHERQLSDWIKFVSFALPTNRYAHQFTVLLPTSLNPQNPWSGPDPEMVRRIVELEKPAHTSFDVKHYFAMFRVGEARLGMETIMEPARPLQDAVLGDHYLSEGFLSLPRAWKAPGRLILGRDTA
jgi:phage tail-like protein